MSDIRPGTGIRRWRRTSSATATRSTSSISSAPWRCTRRRSNSRASWPPTGERFCSWAPSGRRATSCARRPSAARCSVRHRRRLPEGRRGRGQQARHPCGRRGRYEPQPRGHQLRDSWQRRFEPRDQALRTRHRRRGARRAHAIPRRGRRRFTRRVRRGGGRRGRRIGARHVNEKGPSAPFFQPGFCKEQGMTEISAGKVKELREMTGLGMMECKKALAEAGGDLRKAEELLRIKSGAKASKAAGRIAAEGVIGAYLSQDAKLGALVELNCETDFVAKNDEFLAFAKSLAEAVAAENPEDLAQLATPEIEQRRQALVQKIGENIAMHIAFHKPAYLAKTEVPADIVSRERDIQAARARESGKPAAIAAKMVEGALGKFLGEITLLGQPFIKDDKQSIEKMLAARKARVNGYAFLVVGEGIAKNIH